MLREVQNQQMAQYHPHPLGKAILPMGQRMQHINHGLVVASYIVTHKTRCWEVLFRDFVNILGVQTPCLGAYLP